MFPDDRLEGFNDRLAAEAWPDPEQSEHTPEEATLLQSDGSEETHSDLYGEDVRDYDLGEGD